MNSATYQLSAETGETNALDEANFSHAYARRLSAEQLLDAFSQVLGADARFNGYPSGTRAVELPGVRAVRTRDQSASAADKFLTLFGKPPRLQSCECERTDTATLVQAFQLISGEALQRILTTSDNHLERVIRDGKPNREIVREAFWSTLSREPTPSEEDAGVKLLGDDNQSPASRRAALEDLYWGLVTSHEFVIRR